MRAKVAHNTPSCLQSKPIIADVSIAYKLKAILDQEMESVTTTGLPLAHVSSPEWIIDGIEIKSLQHVA